MYVGPTQINAIVPGGVYGSNQVAVEIVSATSTVATTTIPVRPSHPGVFLTSVPALFGFVGYATALNQDGTQNSASNPAALGSIVTVWATGGGVSSRPLPDGAIIGSSLGAPALSVSVFSGPIVYSISLPPDGQGGFIPPGVFFPGSDSLEVLYAGDAPGMVEGVLQVNFRLPPQAPSVTNLNFWLQIGGASSNYFTVYLSHNFSTGGRLVL
jgi:hypothetical protein